ncbi:MAG: hypothetical protein KIH69_021930 [Anaerolineae bacterium]|nr:hypothetical protein [Anaerolineae bacterium]
MPEKLLIYESNHCGLSNRVFALIGYQALGYYRGLPFYLFWCPDNQCNENFENLFETNEINIINETKRLELMSKHKVAYYSYSFSTFEIWQKYASDLVSWEEFEKYAFVQLEKLQPQQEIVNIVERFSRLYRLFMTVGIHIRYTDNVIDHKKWGDPKNKQQFPWFDREKVSNLSGFIRFIERDSQEKQNNYFVATDNLKVEKLLIEKFDSQGLIYIYRKEHTNDLRLWGNDVEYVDHNSNIWHTSSIRESSIKDGLIELLLLSKCKVLIGSSYSTFSALAARWGKIPIYYVEGDEVPGYADTPPTSIEHRMSQQASRVASQHAKIVQLSNQLASCNERFTIPKGIAAIDKLAEFQWRDLVMATFIHFPRKLFNWFKRHI